ncbi:hypothetical protein J2Z81_001188 [Virgibacillus campisalis]|uniref:Uncharacterized protein n=1 Tax=Virgibacillus alimentarius TaxID=698769 RepID=A0ABS4S8B5_9BACI|nr:hypothetical protein [Virgibacillus alimentarius]
MNIRKVFLNNYSEGFFHLVQKYYYSNDLLKNRMYFIESHFLMCYTQIKSN